MIILENLSLSVTTYNTNDLSSSFVAATVITESFSSTRREATSPSLAEPLARAS